MKFNPTNKEVIEEKEKENDSSFDSESEQNMTSKSQSLNNTMNSQM